MAEVLPLNALHYDLDAVGSLQDVVAPPYDVIDPAMRAELLARSPYNAVAIDLPKPYGETGPQAAGKGDPYADAAQTIDAWQKAGRPGRGRRAGDLGDGPGLHRRPTAPPTPATASSPGSGSRTSRPARSCPTSAPCPAPSRTASN